MRAKSLPISRARRAIIELMHFAKSVPAAAGERRMILRPLVAARAAAADRPPWPAIFAKALGVTAGEFPELRRAYLKFPRPHLAEYPQSVAFVVVERAVAGELLPLAVLVGDPAAMPLTEIAGAIRHAATAPVGDVRHFHRALRIGQVPWPLRRPLWWLGLNIARQRARYFGTFAVSSVAGYGVTMPAILTPQSFALTYDPIDQGTMTVRLIFDHRVADGAQVARILVRLEQVLNGAICEEVLALAPAPHRRPLGDAA